VYDHLEGTVAVSSPARLVLDVGGVGYQLSVPLGRPMPAAGERAKLWVHLVVREDAHSLYGFAAAEDRELFRLLLRVKGVGPAMALGVLSGMDRGSLLQAILNAAAKKLPAVKGVGKKTAEQILLDLSDKAAELARASGLGAEQLAELVLHPLPPPELDRNLSDAVNALVSVGYSQKEARRQVEAAAKKVDPQRLDELVRVALQS
jgi:Holliday junction DNA helicase RuvA